jgi:hypothetical protein
VEILCGINEKVSASFEADTCTWEVRSFELLKLLGVSCSFTYSDSFFSSTSTLGVVTGAGAGDVLVNESFQPLFLTSL